MATADMFPKSTYRGIYLYCLLTTATALPLVGALYNASRVKVLRGLCGKRLTICIVAHVKARLYSSSAMRGLDFDGQHNNLAIALYAAVLLDLQTLPGTV